MYSLNKPKNSLGNGRSTKLPVRKSSVTGRESRLSTTNFNHGERRRSRSLSVRKTPISGHPPAPGSGFRSKSTEQRHKKKDSRPINDKKWQQQQLHFVQTYFQNIEAGANILNNRTNIRPLTLNMFVDLTNLVLRKLWKSNDLPTFANYCDVLPNILNDLRYPGLVSKTILKTANTMHSWPYVLAILSWLTELEQLETNFTEDSMFQLEDEDSVEDKITKIVNKTFVVVFNRKYLGQNYDDVLNEFTNEYESLKDISPEKIQHLKEQVEQLDEQTKLLEEERVYNEQEAMESEKMINSLRNDLKGAQKIILAKKNYKTKALAQVKLKKEKIEKLKQELEKVGNSNKQLNENIACQEMTVAERKVLTTEIEQLKSQLILRQNTKEHEKKILHDKNLLLSNIKLKLEQKINLRNISLIKPSLKYAKLKDLFLPEQGFLDRGTLETFDDIINKRDSLLAELNTEEAQLKLKIDDVTLKLKQQMQLENSLKNELQIKMEKNQRRRAEIEHLKETAESEQKFLLQQLDMNQDKLKKIIASYEEDSSKLIKAKLEYEKNVFQLKSIEEKEEKFRSDMLLHLEQFEKEAKEFCTRDIWDQIEKAVDDKIIKIISELERE